VNITSKQWFQIVSGIISGFITGAALFTTLFGQDLTIKIIAGLGLCNIAVNAVGSAFATQTSLVKDVLAMPGVEHVEINAKANAPLAVLAVDPTVDKIAPTQAAAIQVAATAKGT
jgi:hypothetical protein